MKRPRLKRAAGVSPDIFLASPKVAGPYFPSFSTASWVRPGTFSKARPAGIFILSALASREISFPCLLM
jgi:hypothetical protein